MCFYNTLLSLVCLSVMVFMILAYAINPHGNSKVFQGTRQSRLTNSKDVKGHY